MTRTASDANSIIAELRKNYSNVYYSEAANRAVGEIKLRNPNADSLLLDSLTDNQNYSLLTPQQRDNLIDFLMRQNF